jgi:hypothetical protein
MRASGRGAGTGRLMRAAGLAALLVAWAGALPAQVPRPRQGPPAARPPADTLRAPGRADSTGTDTSTAGRGRGLPKKPSRDFAPPDSVTAALLQREGYRITRYSADSVRFLVPDKEIRLAGHSLVQRDLSTLEADSVRYLQTSCEMRAAGSPRLFDQSGVVIGEGMRYDACNKAGIIRRANTEYPEGSATWYVRGDIAVDNEENRSYLAHATITSCDLADPHYHFAARDVKWVSRDIMVSRPAVLYIADVPILWLPFIFQDLRKGRRSGLIPPQFGINDIVRNSRSYQRHVSNLGYYWAIGDYADAQGTIDWYAQNFVALNGRVRYRWLDRFITGGLAYSELRQTSGGVSRRISLSHSQDFSLTSRLTANLDYASSSSIISRNAVDPILAVATIDSRLNYSRRFAGGTLAIGGSRTQSLDKPQVTMSFPVVAFAPQPIALGRDVTWSPSFNFTNSTLESGPSAGLLYSGPGAPDTLRSSNRSTTLSVGTPLRLGKWNWSNSLSLADVWSNARTQITFRDPADTTRSITRSYAETYSTSLDWSTGINLPVVFQGSWNLSPRMDIVNTGSGPFMIRNQYTGGRFVSQGKRLGFGVSVSPTFFGLFGGIGPIARIRHSISPSLSWSYAPAATLPLEYARALSPNAATVNRRIDARQTLSLSLSQNFEAKLRPPPRPAGADTAGAPEEEGRKIKLLSIQSSGISFDLEQAKKPGRTGWTTGTMSNSFSSDLLRGFSLSTTHDLFIGPVGYAGSRFSPYLTSVSMRFSLGENTLRGLGSLLGLATARAATPRPDSIAARDTVSGPVGLTAFQRGPLATQATALDRLVPGARSTAFNASVSFDIQRSSRDTLGNVPTGVPQRRTMSGSISFSPTRHWSVSWQTQFNFTTGRFGEHVVRLDRDLHDWRATFSFVQSPNGNFLFNFFIQLIDQPDIKFEYDQRNLRP